MNGNNNQLSASFIETVRKSENHKIGVLPPGPINNEDLFERVGDELRVRQGLAINKEYRGVNKEVWQIFYRMYGGGPVIVREDLDIYSRDISREMT